MPSFTEVFGNEPLLLKNGKSERVHPKELDGLDCVGLYFSAHWCPPCRQFTPVLIKTYNALKAAGKKIEIIFVTSDNGPREFEEYFGTMPWLAVPFGHKVIGELSRAHGIRGIPSFLLLNKDGKVYNMDGRGAVASDPEGKSFPWGK